MHVDLLQVLDNIWGQLCAAHDVTCGLPDIRTLFCGVESGVLDQAERVMVNMLSEIMELTCRFSPWYREPASEFGIVLMTDAAGGTRWALSPVAMARWAACLALLDRALETNRVLLEAAFVVDDLDRAAEARSHYVVVRCQCVPPCMIRVKRPLAQADIVCTDCKQAFVE